MFFISVFAQQTVLPCSITLCSVLPSHNTRYYAAPYLCPMPALISEWVRPSLVGTCVTAYVAFLRESNFMFSLLFFRSRCQWRKTENIESRITDVRANESNVILFFTPLAYHQQTHITYTSLSLTYCRSRERHALPSSSSSSIVAVCKHASLHFILSWADINLLIHI